MPIPDLPKAYSWGRFALASILAALATIPVTILVSFVGRFSLSGTHGISRAFSEGLVLNIFSLPTALIVCPVVSLPFFLRARRNGNAIAPTFAAGVGLFAGAIIGAAASFLLRGDLIRVHPIVCVALGGVNGLVAGVSFALVIAQSRAASTSQQHGHN